MKKVLTALLCLILILSMSVSAFALEATDDYWHYDETTKTLTISGNGDMPIIGGSWNRPYNQYAGSVRKVIIEKGITSISPEAFADFTELTSVSIPEGVTSIGANAFWKCTKLTRVTLPSTVTSIGDASFFCCTSLVSINLPEGLTSIGVHAFQECTSLASIVIPSSMRTIGEGAFMGCSTVSELIIKEGVESIGYKAFLGIGLVTKLTVPGSVTFMGESAFDAMTNLKTLTLSEGITALGEKAFYNCGKLATVKFPSTLKTIGHSAFSACSSLTAAHIPEGVTGIGNSVFHGCTALTDVTIPSTLKELPSHTFAECDSLKSITIPGTVSTLGPRVFDGCELLESVTLKDGLEFIGSYAFTYCPSLKQIHIPGTVSTIDGNAFFSCQNLETVTMGSGVLTLGGYAFDACLSLRNVTLSDTLQEIGRNAFQVCQSLKTITIPGTVTTFGQSIFEASGVQVVIFEDGARTIGRFALQRMTDLIYVVIPESMISAAEGAFLGDASLCHVLVTGAQKDIIIDDYCNDSFKNATWHYHATGEEITIKEICTGTTAYCTICQETIYSYEKAHWDVTHSFGDWKVSIPATTTSQGEEKRVCTVCGEAETRKTDKLTGNENPFSDVIEGKFYYQPVLWAVDQGITTGYKDGTFKPSKTCTRAEVVTFLWRAAGCPEPSSTSNPFSDVSSSKYYYKAVLWAVEKGITLGTTATTFAPSDTCTRAQIVTFLWRYSGKPAADGAGNSFGDIQSGKFYYNAVLWAVGESITTGYRDGTFKPSNFCTRDQIVTFLYRYIVE